MIGVPIKSTLEGMDALLAIVQILLRCASGHSRHQCLFNAALLAVQMLSISDERLAKEYVAYKQGLKDKIVKANKELQALEGLRYKTN